MHFTAAWRGQFTRLYHCITMFIENRGYSFSFFIFVYNYPILKRRELINKDISFEEKIEN